MIRHHKICKYTRNNEHKQDNIHNNNKNVARSVSKQYDRVQSMDNATLV